MGIFASMTIGPIFEVYSMGIFASMTIGPIFEVYSMGIFASMNNGHKCRGIAMGWAWLMLYNVTA